MSATATDSNSYNAGEREFLSWTPTRSRARRGYVIGRSRLLAICTRREAEARFADAVVTYDPHMTVDLEAMTVSRGGQTNPLVDARVDEAESSPELEEPRGYYSIASGRFVTRDEVVEANIAAAKATPTEPSPAQIRREAYEARAAEAAEAGDFVKAREILAEGREAEAGDRYRVTELSIGEAGLTARPSVIDTHADAADRRVVKVYRSNERHLAEQYAAELNKGPGDIVDADSIRRRKVADLAVLERFDVIRRSEGYDYGAGQRHRELTRARREAGYPFASSAPIIPTAAEELEAFERLMPKRVERIQRERASYPPELGPSPRPATDGEAATLRAIARLERELRRAAPALRTWAYAVDGKVKTVTAPSMVQAQAIIEAEVNEAAGVDSPYGPGLEAAGTVREVPESSGGSPELDETPAEELEPSIVAAFAADKVIDLILELVPPHGDYGTARRSVVEHVAQRFGLEVVEPDFDIRKVAAELGIELEVRADDRTGPYPTGTAALTELERDRDELASIKLGLELSVVRNSESDLRGLLGRALIVRKNLAADTIAPDELRDEADRLVGLARSMLRDFDRERRRSMEEAHAQGHHDELPREGCPDCFRR